ncbi:MAG: fibronectin type III domain-containing protein [Solirubrobacteraceae bacterium]
MRPNKSKAVETVRPCIFTFAALLGMVVAMLGAGATAALASAAPSQVKLGLNENCYISTWACWASPGYNTSQQPPSIVTLAAGGELKFADNTNFSADAIWMGSAPMCTGVPTSESTQWEGGCKFVQSGTYKFESPHLFVGDGFNYTKYEVIVEAAKVAGAPVVTTGAAAGVTETQATLEGGVNPEGKATEYHFKYGLTSNYGEETPVTSLAGTGSTEEMVSTLVMHLAPGTTYHYQLVAKNAAGTTEGADRTFKTPTPPGPPIVSTSQANAVDQTEATLKGTVNPNSQATSYYFEWGSSENYGNKTSELQVESDDSIHAETATLSGLEAGKVYHFRIVAKNPSETVTGSDQMFTTASPAPPTPAKKEPTPTPAPTPTSGNPTATTSSSPSAGQPGVEPASGPLFGSVKLASTQHSSSVHGTIDISQAGVGGQLEIALLATTASLAKVKHSSKARVGQFLLSSLKAGVVSFTVPLTSKAKSALRRHKHLAVTVQIVITPAHGAAVTVTKSVVLHS